MVTWMSSALLFRSPGTRSWPERRFARATGYQVAGNSGPGKPEVGTKSLKLWMGPVCARTALVASQVRLLNLAWMRISTGLSRRAPQRLATWLSTFNRCWPSVVPGFPPTGVVTIGSFKPCPGGSAFTIVICTPASSRAGQAASRAAAASGAFLIASLLLERRPGPRSRRRGGGAGRDTADRDRAVRGARGDGGRQERALEVHGFHPIRMQDDLENGLPLGRGFAFRP